MAESQQIYEFKKALKRLAEFRGSGTELISVFIPAGSPLHDTANRLREEMSQASNIKSKSTKTNVISALERILQHFKVYKNTPPNGLTVFAGNVSDNPSKVDIELFSVEPPQKLVVGTYRCDSKFFLEPLQKMVDNTDTYGIIVMDGREATLAIVRGTQTEIVKRLNSTAHQKINKGGQCLAPETLIQKTDGSVCQISELSVNDSIKAIDFNDYKIKDFICSDIFKTNARSYHIIKTSAPSTEIKATPYHRFLIVSDYGIKERYAKNLSIGDKIITARKVEHKGENILIETDKIKLNSKTIKARKYKIPKYLNDKLSYFLGVVCGEGTLDCNRIIIYEGRKDLVKKYYDVFKKTFGIKPIIREVDKPKQKGSFAKKPYFEIRLYGLKIVELVNTFFKVILNKADKREIPVSITRAKNSVSAAFLKGLFDAEGYMDNRMVSIASRSKKLMQQCQILLLRLGVISAFKEKKVSGNQQWYITISDINSLKKFNEYIGFSRRDKIKKLNKMCSKKRNSQQYSDQIPINGRLVYKLIKSTGLRSRDFKCGNFFLDKKSMGRKAFLKSILLRLKTKSKEPGIGKVYSLLNKIFYGDATISKVSSNRKIEENGEFYDITIPQASNFLANGLIVHNSQRRYQRLIEESIELYYKRIGESMDEYFLNKVKGVIVGGPGPAKDGFMKANSYNYQIKVMGVIDTGYTDEIGVREVLGKSEGLIEQQEAVKEKLLVDRFIKEVVNDGLATYGERQVREAIETNQADKVLISEGLDYKKGKYVCGYCGATQDKLIKGKAEEKIMCKCTNEMKLESEIDLLEDLVELSREHKIEVEIISTNTAEGLQLLNGFSGIGAFLRYKTRA